MIFPWAWEVGFSLKGGGSDFVGRSCFVAGIPP